MDTELPSGGSYYDHPANGVLWVALAEKAYAEANGHGFVTTGNVGSDSYDALNDGDPAWALQAITGKSASDFSINPTNIAAAWNAGELIVLCTSNPGQFLHRGRRPRLRRRRLQRVEQPALSRCTTRGGRVLVFWAGYLGRRTMAARFGLLRA